jgi:hypothetical protein
MLSGVSVLPNDIHSLIEFLFFVLPARLVIGLLVNEPYPHLCSNCSALWFERIDAS